MQLTIKVGDRFRFRPEIISKKEDPNEIYTVTEWSEDRLRGWGKSENDPKGWSFNESQITLLPAKELA